MTLHEDFEDVFVCSRNVLWKTKEKYIVTEMTKMNERESGLLLLQAKAFLEQSK